MTVMGKESENGAKVKTSNVEDVYRALIAVKEKASNGASKTLGTGCAVRTRDVFGIQWRKRFHLLISSTLLSKEALQSRENKGKYLGDFEKSKPRIELEKASNTLFKTEHKDFHFIAIGRGRSGRLSHHVLEICTLDRDEVLSGKLICYVTTDSSDKNNSGSFKSHEIAYNSQTKGFETKDEFGHDEFPRGAPVLNEFHEVVGIVTSVAEGRKVEICFISDVKTVTSEQRPVVEAIPVVVVQSQEVESQPESQPAESQSETQKRNGDVPVKPQRANKISRSHSEKSPPGHKGTGKNGDLRHSFRYSNRHGYKVYVGENTDEKGVRRWKPKGFGAKKNLFEGKEPVKFLGARHIASPVTRERQVGVLFNKPRPKLTSSVSLPCKLNETRQPSREFKGVVDRRVASTSNIPAGMYLVKDLPHSVKGKLAVILDDPAKGQYWRKVAIHYRIREAEVNDLAFGASRHISGSETKALLHKLELKRPNLTVVDVVDYLLSEDVDREILNMLLPYSYIGK